MWTAKGFGSRLQWPGTGCIYSWSPGEPALTTPISAAAALNFAAWLDLHWLESLMLCSSACSHFPCIAYPESNFRHSGKALKDTLRFSMCTDLTRRCISRCDFEQESGLLNTKTGIPVDSAIYVQNIPRNQSCFELRKLGVGLEGSGTAAGNCLCAEAQSLGSIFYNQLLRCQ